MTNKSEARPGKESSGIMTDSFPLITILDSMANKGAGATVDGNNIVATWFTYRLEAFAQTRADVITEINNELERRYDNQIVYKWVTGKKAAPDIILAYIDSEMESMLKWLFEFNDWPTKGVKFKKLALALKPAIKSVE